MDKQKVYEALLLIPYGKVTTYKDIAKYLGNSKLARYVGNVLHLNDDTLKYPCFKVVNSKGKLAINFKDGIDIQKERLEKENIIVNNYQVDLNKYHYTYGNNNN